MGTFCIETIVLLLGIVTIVSLAETTTNRAITIQNGNFLRCQKRKDGQQLCICGKNKLKFDRLKGKKCVNGEVIKITRQTSNVSKVPGLRLASKLIYQSARDNIETHRLVGLLWESNLKSKDKAYVPLRNISVEARIDSFAADVTLTQVFVNQEENPIEAIYVFPIEENAAVYSFTAEIDNRTITAVLKEKKLAEEEYKSAVDQGQTAVLMRQSEETLDTFTVNIGALPPGKECQVIIRYVTELELTDENSIRFVIPTTIAPRYNPSLGHLQSPDGTNAEYVQKTPYSMSFQAHILRGEQYKIKQVANLSHPVNVSISNQAIDVSLMSIALDRDIILDIDLPDNRSSTRVSIEKYNNSSKYATLLAFTPRLHDFIKTSDGKENINTEFIFIIDCSGSMTEENRIDLAREAMLLFIRSLPVDSHFNIIRFGSTFDVLFKQETLTIVYNEKTAKEAENVTRSMTASFGGTELLEPLKYLKDHPPIKGRSRQVFVLTDGEISNTNEVIKLCQSMSSTTRIFSFGLGHSPSRSLVKGLARATNGYFVFVPPKSKVDTYVGSQLGRALQPSLVNARLEWHGLSTNGLQALKTIPPLYISDRVLVYELFDDDQLKNENVSVDLLVGDHKINSIKLSHNIAASGDTIRRLAAKALIQELQHADQTTIDSENNSTIQQRITSLSVNNQILSPYTAFVGIETTIPKNNNTHSTVRHIPIQISKGDEHLFDGQSALLSNYKHGPIALPTSFMMSGPRRPMPMKSSYNGAGPSGTVVGSSGGFGSYQYSLPGSHHHMNNFQNRYAPRGPTQQQAAISWASASATDDVDSDAISTTTISVSIDPVRWLINQQSFNGAWLLDDENIEKLTNGKPLSTFYSNVTKDKDALTTALAIAILELKYANEKNLWYAVVGKGRKQMSKFGLTSTQINLLIKEMKRKL